MFKLIFFNQNLNIVKNLYNNIFGELNNLQLIGIASDEKELESLYNDSGANTIIINSKYINNNQIKNIVEKFKVKIIFTEKLPKVSNNKFTLFIPIYLETTELKKILNNFFFKIDEKLIYKKVYNLLFNSNFNFKLLGTTYLINSIVYSYINIDNNVSDNLEKNVYPYIAKKFNVSNSNVKWSIIRSINNYYESNNNQIDKPTPKNLINELLCKLN